MPKHYRLVAFALAGWIFDFFDLILYSFLLYPIEKEFGITDTEAALVYSLSLAFTAVGGICLGIIGDRFGRKSTLILSIILFSVGTLLSGLAWNLPSLIAFRILTAFGIGGEWAAGHTLINETLPKGSKAKASAVIQSGAPIGVALASFVGGYISPVIGWRNSFFLVAAPSLVLAFFMVKYLNESPRFLIFREEGANSRRDLPHGTSYIRRSTGRSFKQLWEIKGILVNGTLLSLWGMMGYWVIFSWTPKILKDMHFTDHQVAVWIMISQAGAFVGYLSFGYIADAVGRFKSTFSGFAVTFSVGVFLFINGLSNGGLALAYVGIFVTGLGTGFFSGYGPLYAALYPAKIRNTCASWCFNVGRLGAFGAPLLVVSLGNAYGYAAALSSASVFSLILAAWVSLVPSSVQQKITRITPRTNPIPV